MSVALLEIGLLVVFCCCACLEFHRATFLWSLSTFRAHLTILTFSDNTVPGTLYDDSSYEYEDGKYRQIRAWSQTPGAFREALAKIQAQRHAQQQLTRGLEVGRAATQVYGRRRIPCEVQHGTGTCTAAATANIYGKRLAPAA